MTISYEQSLYENIISNQLFNSLELMVSPHCNLKCAYCYMKKYNKLDSSPIINKTTIDKAIDVFSKLKKGQRYSIEVFGGEPLIQADVIEYILQKTKDYKQISYILIPSNGYYTSNIESLLTKYPKLQISFSVDGIYNESINRPKHSTCDKELDYDYLFKLYKQFPQRIGFHPMIYSKTVENTYKTAVWFVENMNNPTNVENSLYLLPVRNPENWNSKNIQILIDELHKFKNYCKVNHISMNHTKFNIFRMVGCPRGTTCSLQTTLAVNWDGDLYPCHRLMYPEFKYGNIHTYPKWDFNIILPFYLYHRGNSLICQSCPIQNKNNCVGGCLGAQYEYWGDPFIPIKDTCQLNQKLTMEVIDA